MKGDSTVLIQTTSAGGVTSRDCLDQRQCWWWVWGAYEGTMPPAGQSINTKTESMTQA